MLIVNENRRYVISISESKYLMYNGLKISIFPVVLSLTIHYDVNLYDQRHSENAIFNE